MKRHRFTKQVLTLFSVAIFFSGCSIDAELTSLPLLSSTLLPPSPEIMQEVTTAPGVNVVLKPTGGLEPFTYTPTTSGFLDPATGTYVAPVNPQAASEIVEVTDATGKVFQIKVKVRGFSEHRVIAMPQGVDDQNYPTDAVWLPSGEIFISAIGSDYEGERWATYRSTDVGATWTRVDHFMGIEYMGESHPLAMAANANAVFTCGYAYSYNWNSPSDPASTWLVRRSLDRGLTWQTVDATSDYPGEDHVCYDIAVASGTGYVYTAGYMGNNWVIRESRDNGSTWTTIYDGLPLVGTSAAAFQIAVAPNGTLFVIGVAGSSPGPVFLRGQESLGTWSWTPITSGMPSGAVYGDYQLRGTLQVVDNLTAYYAFRSGSTGRILKTSDGGDTWSVVYTGQNFLQGLAVTADGTLLASGGSRPAWNGTGGDWKVIRSTNSGVSWTALDMDTILSQGATHVQGGLPIVAHPSNGSALAIQSDDKNHHVKTALSTDNGATWTARGYAAFMWAFYGYFQKMVRGVSGDLYASIYYSNENGTSPWSIWKSTDDGKTWGVVDEVDPGGTQSPRVWDLVVGHDDALYAAGAVASDVKIRRSTNGNAWTEVFSAPFTSYGQNPIILARRDNQDTWACFSSSLSSVQVHSTVNGSSWTLTKTFAKPPGSDWIYGSSLKVDTSGRLWLVLNEVVSIGGLTTVVLYSSTDGVTWQEAQRGPAVTGIVYTGGFLRLSPQGELVFWNGNVLKHSTDGGATWVALSQPTGLKDVAWIDGQLFYYYQSSTLSSDVVGVYDAVLGTWQDWESAQDRSSAEEAQNRYEFGWADWNSPFLQVGPDEVYLQETFNDPYVGSNIILRRLEAFH